MSIGSITVVTSFAPPQWKTYAKRMLDTACQFLPPDIHILAYYNGERPEFANKRVTLVDNYAIDDGVTDFLKRHGNDEKKWGKVPGETKENFRWSINKFSHKMYAFYHASQIATTNILLWIDADVYFFSEVPASFLDSMLPYPHYMCTLDRGKRYFPEAGFVGLRTRHPHHKEFMERYIDYCRKDRFVNEAEWHDAFLMGRLIQAMTSERKISAYNLSPGYDGAGHPWLVSPLAQFSDHLKGIPRKVAGTSFKEDLRNQRSEDHWQNLPSRKDLKK